MGAAENLKLIVCCLCLVWLISLIIVAVLTPTDTDYTQTFYVDDQYILDSIGTTRYSGVSFSTPLTGGDSSVTYYLLPSTPALTGSKTTKFGYSGVVSAGNWEYFSFYMPSGSSATVQFTSAQSLYFYVLEGDDNYDGFTSGGNWYSVDAPTNNPVTSYTSYVVNNNGDYNYYWVWYNENSNTRTYTANFTLNRVRYDRSSATDSCSSTVCQFTFDRGSDQVVIAEAAGPAVIDPAGFGVTASYTLFGRAGFYWVIAGPILGFFFVVILILSCILGAESRKRESKEVYTYSSYAPQQYPNYSAPPPTTQQNDYTLPYLPPPSDQSYNAPPTYNAPPPSYNEPPPSYEAPSYPPTKKY